MLALRLETGDLAPVEHALDEFLRFAFASRRLQDRTLRPIASSAE